MTTETVAPAPAPAPTTSATDGGEHERLTHIVPGNPNKVIEASVYGTPLRALCGKVWVPSRDPEKHSMCQTCVAEYERLTGKRWAA